MTRWPNLGLYGLFSACDPDLIARLNDNQFALDLFVQMWVKDFVTELPLDPQIGDAYILETDDYIYDAGSNTIMVWDGEEWVEFIPRRGFITFVDGEDDFFWFNGNDWVLLPKTLGDVNGPNSSLNDSIARWDGVTGKWITDSGVTLDDQDVIRNVEGIYTDNFTKTKFLDVVYSEDDASTGTDANLGDLQSFVVKFTNAGLESIEKISPPIDPEYSRFHVLLFNTGDIVTIRNNSFIRTGVNKDVDVISGSSLFIAWDQADEQWVIVGGTGGGGAFATSENVLLVDDSDTVTLQQAQRELIKISGDGAPASEVVIENGTIDGQELEFIGMSDEYSVTFDGGNIISNGPIVLYFGSRASLIWIEDLSAWVGEGV